MTPAELSRLEPEVRAQIQAAQEAWRRQPGDPAACGELGMILHAYGWHVLAGRFYHSAWRAAPLDSRWPYLAAIASSATSSAGEQVSLLEQAIRLSPNFLAALLRRGELALQGEDVAQARVWFQRALAAGPGTPLAMVGLGQCLAQEGNLTEARALLESALAIEPRQGRALHALAKVAQAEGKETEAQALRQRHETSLKRLEAPDPLLSAVEALRLDSDHVLRQASARHEEGRFEEAISGFKKALERNPNLAMAHYNIGLALQQLGRHREAAPHYLEFLKSQPGSPDALNNLGLCAQAQGQREAAANWFEQAIVAAPTYLKARLNRASLWLETQQEQAATRDLLEVLRQEPQNTRAIELLLGGDASRTDAGRHRKLAQFLLEQKLGAAAVETLRHGLRERPEEWKTAIALAWLLATTNHTTLRSPREALGLVLPLVERGTAAGATALDTLAAAHAAVGDHEAAIKAATAALGKSNNAEQSAAIRRRLEMYEGKKAYRDE